MLGSEGSFNEIDMIEYKDEEENEALPNQNHHSQCGGEFEINSNSLVITSPNYPEQYDKNMRCNYLIKVI